LNQHFSYSLECLSVGIFHSLGGLDTFKRKSYHGFAEIETMANPKLIFGDWFRDFFKNLFRKPKETVAKEPPWIREGKRVWGLHEIRDNAELKRWLRSDGPTLGDPGKLPWCGDYAETAVKNALPNEPFTGPVGENPYWARNWRHFGKHVEPCKWCVGVFTRGSGGHVGFLAGEDDSNYYVLGGNQGDTVNIVRISKSRLIDTRWPVTYKNPNVLLPRMSPNGIPKSVNEF